ncbi:MAG: TIR domain-containing protein [Desulfobacterales bacterium]|nr:TIR domain-containing protein [Desulfobacterales bacterium]
MTENDFEYHVFISYAHIDNQTLTKEQEGWISVLHRALEIRLAQLLGERPAIWRDPKLKGNDQFDQEIIESLYKALSMVAVLSPGYIGSEWCIREIKSFIEAAVESGGLVFDNKSRLFKVIKTKLPLEKHPREIQNLLGYEFFSIDPETNRIKEFNRGFGSYIEPEYMDRIEDLATDIRELLEVYRSMKTGSDAPEAPSSGVTVYLAETTHDLQPELDDVRRELRSRGHTVLPDRPLPSLGPELEKNVREDLARCALSIHLIGAFRGVVPEAADRSNVEMQLALAGEFSGKKAGFTRMIWMPRDLRVKDERQKALVNSLEKGALLQPGDDLLKVPVEDLKTAILDKLDHITGDDEEEWKDECDLTRIYLVYDQRDLDAIQPLEDFLFDREYEVLHPLFTGDESDISEEHRENLRICDAVLIYYGRANEVWLRGKLRDLRKASGYGRACTMIARAIYVAAPEDKWKKRLKTREVDAVIKNFGEFSPDCLSPFLNKLLSEGH